MSKKLILETYFDIHTGIVELLENARLTTARCANAIMTASYWEIGRRIVEFEQKGKDRAIYGEALLKHLGEDLSRRFGRGFSWRNLTQMRAFYLAWPQEKILQTLSAKSVLKSDGVDKGVAEVRYALENLPNKVLAAEYRTILPDEKLIADQLERSRRELEESRRIKISEEKK